MRHRRQTIAVLAWNQPDSHGGHEWAPATIENLAVFGEACDPNSGRYFFTPEEDWILIEIDVPRAFVRHAKDEVTDLILSIDDLIETGRIGRILRRSTWNDRPNLGQNGSAS